VHPAIAEVARYFQELAPGDALPRRQDYRPTRVRSVLGYIFLIEVLPDDYCWNLIGEHVATLFGINGTNDLLSDFEPPALRERLKTTYDAVVKTRSFLFARGRYTWPNHAMNIERLLVPMANADGHLNFIFGVSIPDVPTEHLAVSAGIGAGSLEIDEQISGCAQTDT
jgi:hypothetical protein